MPPCKFFLQGHCNRGWRCTFDHQKLGKEEPTSLRAAAVPFVPNANCFTPIANSPSIFFTEPCRFFSRGFCSKGKACSYRHIVPLAPSNQEVVAGRTAQNQQNVISKFAREPALTAHLTPLEEHVDEDAVTNGTITNPVRLSNLLTKAVKD
jgi:Zinc finger C-x8-C-x5-C-x3-H type (and similar)